MCVPWRLLAVMFRAGGTEECRSSKETVIKQREDCDFSLVKQGFYGGLKDAKTLLYSAENGK